MPEPGSSATLSGAEADSIDAWLKRHRQLRGLTQQQVVDAVLRAGASLSRGHYGNFEAGVHTPGPSIVGVLDLVLQGEGSLIELAERLSGTQLTTPLRADVIGLARTIHEDLPDWAEDASPPAAGDDVPDSTRAWWNEKAVGSAFVVEGRDEVKRVLHDLLSLVATRDPRDNESIEFAGALEGFRGGEGQRAGFPLRVRDVLRRAMERGWVCRHYIPVPPQVGPEATALVRVAAPLMPCEKYEPRLIDPEDVPAVGNLVLLPGVAAVELLSTGTAKSIDAAVVHKRDEVAKLIEKRIRSIASLSGKPFVVRDVRTNDPLSPTLTADELSHRRFLASAAKINGPSRLVVDRWPTAMILQEDYVSVIERRRKAAKGQGEGWGDMIVMQRDRFEAFRRHLESGLPYQVIITRENLRLPSEKENHWRALNLAERKRQRAYLAELLATYKNFEIGIAPDPLAQRIEKCRWEVHDGAPEGLVLLQTHYTPGFNTNDWSPGRQERRVDLKITAAAAVNSFSAYFRHIWLQTELLTPKDLTD